MQVNEIWQDGRTGSVAGQNVKMLVTHIS